MCQRVDMEDDKRTSELSVEIRAALVQWHALDRQQQTVSFFPHAVRMNGSDGLLQGECTVCENLRGCDEVAVMKWHTFGSTASDGEFCVSYIVHERGEWWVSSVRVCFLRNSARLYSTGILWIQINIKFVTASSNHQPFHRIISLVHTYPQVRIDVMRSFFVISWKQNWRD